MKIDQISLTIFTWDNIPATRYHAGSFTQQDSNLGLLRIRTDDGHEGNAFLGAAPNPASPQNNWQTQAVGHYKAA